MAVTDVIKNLDARTLTVTAAFDAPVARVWDLYADPRKLERWWGPPTYPATVTEHALEAGGRVRYYMTSPEGERYHGLWHVTAVDPQHLIEAVDHFADEDGEVNADLPASAMRLVFTQEGDWTIVTSVTTFASSADLQQVLDMGMEEGLRGAMGQMDALLTE